MMTRFDAAEFHYWWPLHNFMSSFHEMFLRPYDRPLELMQAESFTTNSIVIYIRNHFSHRPIELNIGQRRKCQVHAYEW